MPSLKQVNTRTFCPVASTSLIRSAQAACLALWSATRSLVMRARNSVSLGLDGSELPSQPKNSSYDFHAPAASICTGTQDRIFGGRSSTSSFLRRSITSLRSRLSSAMLDAPSVTQPKSFLYAPQ